MEALKMELWVGDQWVKHLILFLNFFLKYQSQDVTSQSDRVIFTLERVHCW